MSNQAVWDLEVILTVEKAFAVFQDSIAQNKLLSLA